MVLSSTTDYTINININNSELTYSGENADVPGFKNLPNGREKKKTDGLEEGGTPLCRRKKKNGRP